MGPLEAVKFAELRIPVDPKKPNGAYNVVFLHSTTDAVFDGVTGESLADTLSRLGMLNVDGVSFNGTASVSRYTVCSTAAATAAKTVSLTGFALTAGARATVKFTNGNTAANPTLNINGKGAKALFYQGVRITDSTAIIKKGGIYDLLYDGTNLEFVGNVATGYGN